MNQTKKLNLVLFFAIGLVAGLSLSALNNVFFNNNLLFAENKIEKEVKDKAINPEDEDYFKFYKMFRETYYLLKKEFVEKNEVTSKKLHYGAIKGMLENLGDPYTTFMDPEITKEFNIDMMGSFGGLGIHIGERDGWLTVISPIEDTPAWRAGLKPNDKIIEIETNTTKNMSVNEAVTKLRGKPNTKITITILREGISEPFKVTLTREIINIKSVKSDIVSYKNKKIAYVKILEFSMPTADELQKHMKDVLDKKPDGLILDLRNNPGGLLNIVAVCVNDYIERGLIVYTRGRTEENNSEFFAKRSARFVPLELPIVVMINGGSASASEIFAGAMQDTGRGVLVGTKSFGKGSVQKTYTFPEDGSLIKYTVAKYYTPAGQVIDGTGLTPDVEEKMWLEDLSEIEKSSIIKLQYTNIIKDFLTKIPNPSEKQLSDFQNSLKQEGVIVGTKSLQWLITIKKSENILPKLYDLEFDNQLVKALDVIMDYKKYAKEIKYYDSVK